MFPYLFVILWLNGLVVYYIFSGFSVFQPNFLQFLLLTSAYAFGNDLAALDIANLWFQHWFHGLTFGIYAAYYPAIFILYNSYYLFPEKWQHWNSPSTIRAFFSIIEVSMLQSSPREQHKSFILYPSPNPKKNIKTVKFDTLW